jgi:quercetin dioxygenase-like cupin family protein
MKIIPTKTTKGPEELFTGDVYFDVIAKGETPSRVRVNTVRFTPGARTAWHKHSLGQTLHITEGIGLIQEKGGEITVMKPGESFHSDPDTWHWHGATSSTFMSHLAIWEDDDTTWGEHVTDEEYNNQPNV